MLKDYRMSENEMCVKQGYESCDGLVDISNRVVRNSSQNENIYEPEVKINSSLQKMDYGFCEKCKTNLYQLKAHEAAFHQNKEEKRCTFCGQLFLKRTKLVKHILEAHETNNVKCHYCLKEDFIEFEELFNHLEEHLFLHIYICHICQESFSLKSNLDDHLTMHLSSWKRPYLECPSCKMRFESQRGGVRMMKKHWIQEHSKHFKCIYCSKKFNTFIVFYNHCLRHSKQLPYVCEECGLGFRKHCRMKEHLETTHWNKFNYKCSDCGLKFKHKPSFIAHLRSHDDSLCFTCNYCSKLFIRKVSLLDHFVEKSCSLCNEEFHCKAMFNAHFEQNHKTDRIFACDECSKSYTLENALKRHKTLMHPKRGDNLFRCSMCCYETITRHNLNRHKRRNHRSK